MSISPETIFQTLNQNIITKWLTKYQDSLFTNNFDPDDNKLIKSCSAEFSTNSHLYFPNFFTTLCINGLLSLMDTLPSKRVHVGKRKERRWTEYEFPDKKNVLKCLFELKALSNFLFSVVPYPQNSITDTEAWINRYSTGEHIAKHRDSKGSFQIIIGLQDPSANAPEGRLFVGNQMISLYPGDLFIFQAHKLPHYTIPVNDPEKKDRINAVLRFYEEPNEMS